MGSDGRARSVPIHVDEVEQKHPKQNESIASIADIASPVALVDEGSGSASAKSSKCSVAEKRDSSAPRARSQRSRVW